ncbi:MAG TPA: asparagine synthase (glutamine-hydrolyzing) [Chitinophagaceae bacterium]|nr:asparagine synthase (glutamine-hydrolyzing) [Chitinophagaceae bacterium]
MCGIAGILLNSPNPAAPVHLKKMTDVLAHRGPDGEGIWSNRKNTVHLGHRRLSIIDLSANAAQPMPYAGRYHIVHNGEIYNYTEIRNFLQNKGYSFTSKSDTEVIMAAYDYWKERCLQQFDGMFAFAIWDEKEEILFAARDRFGEKPFYYYEDEENFVFASEMKALWKIGIEKVTDKKMLLNYLALGHVQNCVDKEQTFFESVYSLPPSYYLKFSPASQPSRIKRYWQINKEIKIDITPAVAIEKFNELLNQSIRRRLRSDVAIGTSLSGGLDSSTIAACITAIGKKPAPDDNAIIFGNSPGRLQTFSAVFPGFENNEAGYVNLVAEHLAVNNHKAFPSADGLIREFEKLCYHQEEPFQSSGIYAQYKVFELAKQQQVKVLLDGQGADEVLGGYPKFIHWYLQEVLSRHKLGSARVERKAFLKNDQPFEWDIKNLVAAFLPSHAAIQLERKEYLKTIRHPGLSTAFLKAVAGRTWEGIHKPIVTKLNDILYFHVAEMGLEELLRFADRNSMAHGREVRLPFLNHELVEFVFSLPSQLKMHEGWTKYLLRKSMDKKLPDEIVWRKEKVGFETPQKSWMQEKALQEYIHESKRKLVKAGILNKDVLDKQAEPKAAHDDRNFDWRYLCAAQLL